MAPTDGWKVRTPTWTPNTTDAGGRRYRYGNQPRVAHWNLAQLANALVPLVGDAAPLQEAIDAYPRLYESEEERMLASKLGLPEPDRGLTDDLGQVLQLLETDMTLF